MEELLLEDDTGESLETSADELIQSMEPESHPSDDVPIDLDENFDFGEHSSTRLSEVSDDKTAKFEEQEDGGTVPMAEAEDLAQISDPFAPKSFSKPAPERAAVGRASPMPNIGSIGPMGAALAQNENLRLAQDRILELEKEIERLRIENEELGSAGETLRRRSDELLSINEELERKLEHEVSTSNQEKDILKNSRDLLRKESEELKHKNSELEIRISTNIQRVRVRERELENRLELMKVESKALVRSKDEMILDLKRQIDQLNLELGNYRVKSQDLNKQIADRQETLRRTVKALRLALSMMEGDEQSPLKKAK